MLINGSWRCITLVCLLDLPYMVTQIMKPTSPLNSHWKMVLEDVSHLCLPDLPHKVTDHETDINIEFTSKNGFRRWWGLYGDSMGTPQDFEGIIMTFEQAMQSPWGVHGNVWGTVKYSIWKCGRHGAKGRHASGGSCGKGRAIRKWSEGRWWGELEGWLVVIAGWDGVGTYERLLFCL